MAGMQEQFPASWPRLAGMPEMQEQFPAGRYAGLLVLPAPAGTSHVPVGRNCSEQFPACSPQRDETTDARVETCPGCRKSF